MLQICKFKDYEKFIVKDLFDINQHRLNNIFYLFFKKLVFLFFQK